MSYFAPRVKKVNGAVTVEMPRHLFAERAILHTIPSKHRRLISDGIYWIEWEYFGSIMEILRHYFPTVIDLSRARGRLPKPTGWDKKWQGYLSGPGNPKNQRKGNPWAPRAVLHVTDDAPLEVVAAAYRALVKIHHPDVGGDRERFEEIDKAYKILTQGGLGVAVSGSGHRGN